jgi:hypothetical protein
VAAPGGGFAARAATTARGAIAGAGAAAILALTAVVLGAALLVSSATLPGALVVGFGMAAVTVGARRLGAQARALTRGDGRGSPRLVSLELVPRERDVEEHN